jgi:hypothetical protein
LDVGWDGRSLHVGGLLADHLTEGGNFLEKRLEGHVLLGALGLQGGKCLGE